MSQQLDYRASKTVCVDFDGVIHAYSKGWKDGTIYDNHMPQAFIALSEIAAMGFRIIIFTARQDALGIREYIDRWLKHYALFPIEYEINTCKPPAAIYIDDKGYHFDNWFDTLDSIHDIYDKNLERSQD